MAKTITTGYTDTAIAGNPAMTMTVGKLNFGADWRVSSEGPDDVTLVNITSPFGQEETARFSKRAISDIYAKTSIEPGARLATRAGNSFLIELNEVLAETDDTDASYLRQAPLRGGIWFQVPSYGNITAAHVQTFLLRLIGLTNETGLVTTAGINNILHGVLKKADV